MLLRIRTPPFLPESFAATQISGIPAVSAAMSRVMKSGRPDIGLTMAPFPSPPHPR